MGGGRGPLYGTRPRLIGSGDARTRPPATGERADGTPPMGRRAHGPRCGIARGEGVRRAGAPRPSAPRGRRLRGEPRRSEARGGFPARRPRTVPPEGRPGAPPGPRLVVPEPGEPLREDGAARPRVRHLHEGPGRPRRGGGLGRRRGRVGGTSPTPARDPR